MNRTKARAAVEEIRSIGRNDDEVAHAKEDGLRADFIQHIADGDFGELTDIAKIILETDKIDFCRWYA